MTCNQGNHEYHKKDCPSCGTTYCWSCCEATNIHEGGKHAADFMICPSCGDDYYSPAGEKCSTCGLRGSACTCPEGSHYGICGFDGVCINRTENQCSDCDLLGLGQSEIRFELSLDE